MFVRAALQLCGRLRVSTKRWGLVVCQTSRERQNVMTSVRHSASWSIERNSIELNSSQHTIFLFCLLFQFAINLLRNLTT